MADQDVLDKVRLHAENIPPGYTGIDQLEFFSAKFSRLQNSLGDKLLPLLLKLAAEPTGNLH